MGFVKWELQSGGAPLHHRPRKLTPAQTTEIRLRYADGETASALAAEFGMSTGGIRFYTAPRREF